jgi:GntR family transcriptional repressor for pyruvate dehydrogenase complex
MTVSPEHPLSELPEVVLRPVRGHHAFEACVEQLATAIRLGVYPLGTTLPPERELAVMLSVSRATLREAMAALREAGLVETTRGRGGGTVVTLKPRTPSARAAYVAAALKLSDVRRAQLEEAHAAVIGAPKPAAHRQADSRFHLTIASLADSPRLIEAVTSVQATLHEMLLAIPVLQANIAHSDRQHAVVVKAILAGDADRARRAMEEHCDDTAALLRGLVG